MNLIWRVNISIKATLLVFYLYLSLSTKISLKKLWHLKSSLPKCGWRTFVWDDKTAECGNERSLVNISQQDASDFNEYPKIFVRISEKVTFWQSGNKRKCMKSGSCGDSQKPGEEKIAARPAAKERIAYITPDNPALQGQGHHPDLQTQHTHTQHACMLVHVGCLCSHPNNVIFWERSQELSPA